MNMRKTTRRRDGMGLTRLSKMMCSVVATGALCLMAGVAQAGTIFVVDGSAVTTADRTATFDDLVQEAPLSDYSEDSLNIHLDRLAHFGYGENFPSPNGLGFSGPFHYRVSVNPTYISGTDGALFSGVELNIGSGFKQIETAYLRWEAFRSDVTVGSGIEIVPKGTQVGWSDASGFHELRIAVFSDLDRATNSVYGRAVIATAVDNVHAQVLQVVPLPPAAFLGLGLLGGLGLIGRLRKRRSA